MSRFQISEEEYEAIKAKEKESKEKQISKRLRILMLRYEGYKVREIAKMYGMRITIVPNMVMTCSGIKYIGLIRMQVIRIGTMRRMAVLSALKRPE